MKTFIFDPIADEALSYALKKVSVISWDNPDISNYTDAEAVLVRTFKMTHEIIDSMPNLKIIAKHGVGVDNIDIAYAKRKNIIVTNTPTANMNSVAELIIGFIFNCARKITQSHLTIKKGIEKNSPLHLSGYELSGKTLGLIGLGKIGSIVGTKMCKAFDMNILVYDPFASKKQCDTLGFQKIDHVDDICKNSDIISISVPLTDVTKNMINAHEFSLMKKNAILINSARGGIVNETALLHALQEHKIFGAALDVFAIEPIASNHPLLNCDNFVANPHNGANTRDALIRMGMEAIDEIVRIKNGEPPAHSL